MNVGALMEVGRTPRDLFPWGKGQKLNACLSPEGDAFLFDVCVHGLQRVDFPLVGYGGYTVMDDSERELKRLLQGVKHATGNVLKTGLGFGCFVRMCLTKPDVEHIDVIEIDGRIIEHFGAQFASNSRVTIHHADAFEFEINSRKWDFAWHDIYTEGNEGLAHAHVRLIKRFLPHCKQQGAWQLPRETKKFVERHWPGLVV